MIPKPTHPTPAVTIASCLYPVWRQEAIHGVEVLNSQRFINRFAAAIQRAIDDEVKRLLVDDAEKKQLRKDLAYARRQVADMHAGSERREKTMCQLRAALEVATKRRRGVVDKPIPPLSPFCPSCSRTTESVGHLCDDCVNERERKESEPERKRLKVDEMEVRVFEHPAILKAE